MKNIFRIARWEFLSRVKSRSFFFNTFISPLLFTAIFILPIYFYNYQPEVSVKLIGVIDLSEGRTMGAELSKELNRQSRMENKLSEYQVYNISVKNSKPYQIMVEDFSDIKNQLDSLSSLHNQIKVERTGYYKNRGTPNRQFALDKSYERLREVREEKELIEIEMYRFQTALDSMYEKVARISADSMIISNLLNSYMVFPGNFAKTGFTEYHSKNPGDLLDTDRLEKVMQNITIRKRMIEAKIERNEMRDLLRPIHMEKYKVSTEDQEEWNIYAQFYGPLIGVFLLFMAIFTSGGYLFSGVLLEKSNRVIEVLLSYATSNQIMGGKILGLGSLGLVQILIWFLITGLFVSTGFVSSSGLSYLNMENGFYFLLYFSLGFLFYGAIFITIGSVFPNEYDAQQINQFLRTLAIFPVLLSLLVLSEPNSGWIRILSYIPFLSPSFMILRIPLSSVAISADIYITTFIMIFSIAATIYIAGKLFRVTTLMQGKKPSWNEIVYWIKNA
ncbi:MAG: ABC transporter permease [Calditrichaeota bacterium]|nr:MAG: ABC transporter permease [Calditrichota bacterium]MBL1205391.1 ABC transporter permease [Calditrichota bacterium]NOG45220.1 ABC transporter permease [Calditrichota bacterium]